jgi:hypothetical protein
VGKSAFMVKEAPLPSAIIFSEAGSAGLAMRGRNDISGCLRREVTYRLRSTAQQPCIVDHGPTPLRLANDNWKLQEQSVATGSPIRETGLQIRIRRLVGKLLRRLLRLERRQREIRNLAQPRSREPPPQVPLYLEE